MAHAPALGRSQAGDIGDDRLGHMLADEGGGLGLLWPADLADHHHGGGFGIGFEQLQDVSEGAAIDRIAPDADAGGHADAQLLHLRRRLIAQRARAADDADRAALIDMAGHDAKHRLTRADDAGAVRADQAHAVLALVALHEAFHPDHVLGRNAVCDSDADLDAGVRRFHDRVSGKGRWYENDTGGGAGFVRSFLHGVEHRTVELGGASLTRRHTAHDVGAVGDHLLGVEAADVAGKALDDDGILLVNQYTHDIPLSGGFGVFRGLRAAPGSNDAISCFG